MTGIYKITSPTKRIYIGQSLNVKGRFNHYKKYKCKAQTKLYNSLIKYGADKHVFEIICECDKSELNNKERFYQEIYNSTCQKKGLNCQLVNTDFEKRIFSIETRLKMSQNRKGKTAHNKGVPLSKESIEKRTEKQANVYINLDTFIFYSFKELMILYNKKSTTLRRHIDKSKNIKKI